ncbi:MAG: class I SAM-dependent methyltransferase, partial [Actinobacteria bacterium]|nr:class I SAM-dependent methyltransferase [Actinomycetota bacterium]
MENPWEEIYKKGELKTELHQEMKKVSEILVQSKSKRILDLGCGSGRHLVYLADKGFELYGLDSSPTGLAITLAGLHRKDLSAHLTTLHDMSTLP